MSFWSWMALGSLSLARRQHISGTVRFAYIGNTSATTSLNPRNLNLSRRFLFWIYTSYCERFAEHNVISGVLAELANIRTPAALLGGAALGTMFVQLKPGGNKRLHLIYTMLSTSAFSLQLVCVLCSTVRAGVATSSGGFPIATQPNSSGR